MDGCRGGKRLGIAKKKEDGEPKDDDDGDIGMKKGSCKKEVENSGVSIT